jgi:malate synthase
VWQWIQHPRGALEDGRKVTPELARQVLAEELAKVKAASGDEAYASGHYEQAGQIFERLATAPELADFLTLPAYAYLD